MSEDRHPPLSTIYALRDPRTTQVRYVGVATKPKRRLWRHIDDARKGASTHVHRWIATLLAIGLEPEMLILEADVPREREVYWIAHFRSLSADLTNIRDGGSQSSGHRLTTEQIEAIRRRNTGRVVSPETKARIAASLRGMRPSADTRAKLSAARKGIPKSEEMRRRLSTSMTGRQYSPETIERMRQAAIDRGVGRIEPRDERGRIKRYGSRSLLATTTGD